MSEIIETASTKNNTYMKDYIPWFHIEDNSVVVNTNGSYQISFVFSGMDFTTKTESDIEMFVNGVNIALKQLPEGYIAYFELQRNIIHEYNPAQFNDSLLNYIEQQREQYFNTRNFYESKSYLTLVYKPETDNISKLMSLIEGIDNTGLHDFINVITNKKNPDIDQERITLLKHQVESKAELVAKDGQAVAQLLATYFADIRVLTIDETLTYLHSQVSPIQQEIKGNYRDFLSYYLTDSSFIGGKVPSLGDYYVGIISIIDFPVSTYPFMLSGLNNLKSEFRYCTRFIPLTKEKAIEQLQSKSRKYVQQAKSAAAFILDYFRTTSSADIDTFSLANANDVDAAYHKIASNQVSFGHFTGTLVFYNKDKKVLEKDIQKTLTIITNTGFIGRKEYTNIENAFFSTITGCYQYNIRSYLMKSTNFIHNSPLSFKWSGEKENRFFKEKGYKNYQALYQGISSGSVPFYLNLHQKDIAHTLITGATGAGKSVLLNTIVANFFKYDNSKVFVFDKSASCRVLCKAIGGNFYNLMVDTEALNFQPLANITDDPTNRTELDWAFDWIKDFINQDGEPLTPSQRTTLYNGLKTVAHLPQEERTITALKTVVNDYDIRERLTPLTKDGNYGNLFDNTKDKFGTGSFQVFEMEELMQRKDIVATTLAYMFHKIEQQLTGQGPALIVLDECWLFLDHPIFKEKIRSFIKDLRKKNAAVVLATQNLTDLKEDIKPVIQENVFTKIYLPNHNATNPTIKSLYIDFGLNEIEIEQLKEMKPKQDYFYYCNDGKSIFRLDLQPIELMFYGATSKEDQLKVESLKHLSQEEFINEWIEYKSNTIRP